MKRVILVLSFYILVLAGCENYSDSYTYRAPEKINDGLDVGTLAEAGMDSEFLSSAVNGIKSGLFPEVHSLLIFKDNKLVLEEYFRGHKFNYEGVNHHGEIIQWTRDSLHRVMSVTKSITSICAGIAVDKGYINSVHQSIFDYLPDYQHLKNEERGSITIEHMLTMTSGLEGNEHLVPYSQPTNDIIKTYFSEDPIAYILDKPMLYKPGLIFQYYGGSNFVLSEIIRNASGLNLDEFAGKYLFEPLGISPYDFLQLNKGVIDGAGGLLLKPRDMLKLGITFLNSGKWNEEQIISEEWVEKSSNPYPGNNWLNYKTDYWGMRGYSYSWWTHSFVYKAEKIDMYYASGWGGQYIMVIPEFNMVVVFTGGNYITKRPSFDILKKYIIAGIH